MPNEQQARGENVGRGSGQRGRGGRGNGRRGRGGENGRGGRGRGRGYERGISGNSSGFEPVPGPSSRSYEEEIELMRKSKANTKKVLAKLEPGVQKELDARKRKKELSRSLLPDAPPRKRQKKTSPERSDCRLISGTPSTPPAPKLQPWEIRKQQVAAATAAKQESEDDLVATQDSRATPISTISTAESSDVELMVDFTSGLLKTDNDNWLCMPDTASQIRSDSVINSPAAEVDQAPPAANAKKINMGSISEKNVTELQKWLESVESDEDEVDVVVANIPTDGLTDILPHQMPTAHNFEDIATDLSNWLTNDDKESDRLITELIPTDHLTFDWVEDHNTFQGKRESFTGIAGPTFPVTDNMTPLDIFMKFFDDELWDLIIRQTNKYATRQIDKHLTPHSRLNFYQNVDRDEMAKFLAILILQGLLPNPVEKSYWAENGYLTLKYFGKIMTYNRFILIKRLLHFSDQTDCKTLTNDEKKLRKIQPVIDLLQEKFRSLYFPKQEIAIDESLLKWQGRLSFAQKIATKAARVGVKSYELCESDTGYLWRFFVYTGKKDGQTDLTEDLTDGHIDLTEGPTDGLTDIPPLPTNVTSKIVHDLVKPLYNRGHTLVMDNFYNSPLLSRYLKSQGTDCFGTLRINREFVPEAMKKIQKHELREGEIVHSYTQDLSIVMWRDSNVVSLISTYHDGVVGGAEKYGRYKYKPSVVLDYNRAMGGVDRKDQLLSAFPIERVRNLVWYKKVFRRLLNTTLMNAHIIYSTRHKTCSARDFRRQVAEGLVRVFQPSVQPLTVKIKTIVQDPPHLKKARPVLIGNHFVCSGPCKVARCVWCKKSRTRYICEQCQVALCLDICFKEYHTVP